MELCLPSRLSPDFLSLLPVTPEASWCALPVASIALDLSFHSVLTTNPCYEPTDPNQNDWMADFSPFQRALQHQTCCSLKDSYE